MTKVPIEKARVQFITHATARYDTYEGARLALEGGCRWIQLRMKGAAPEEVTAMARRLQPLCRDYGSVFLLDDHVELVREVQADGVHLGKNDMPVDEARRRLGPDCIIGGTANTFDDIQHLHAAGADYIGCGPFRFTETKKNLSPILGLDGYRDIVRQMRAAAITLPMVAIGGITVADLPALLATGVDGIAVSSVVLNAEDPVKTMETIIKTHGCASQPQIIP